MLAQASMTQTPITMQTAPAATANQPESVRPSPRAAPLRRYRPVSTESC